jgi:hypothetical protein
MWRLAALGALLASAAAFAAGWKVHDWRDAGAELAAARTATAVVQRQDRASLAAAVSDQRTQDRVRVVTRTLVERIPARITAAVDARYPLPWGFVRVHDAAAAGLDLPAFAPGAERADDAPSGVALSEAARVVAANYGDCRADQARLAALQAWTRAEGLAK